MHSLARFEVALFMESVHQSMNPGEPGGVSPRILRRHADGTIYEESRGLRHRARLDCGLEARYSRTGVKSNAK